jgi:dTDP-glucose pyrophosphorylase
MITERHTAVILTAGNAARLRPLTTFAPKAAMSIGGRPAVTRAIEQCRRAEIDRFVFVVAPAHRRPLESVIRRAYASLGLTLEFVEQPCPLGPGDALHRALRCIDEGSVLLVLGDTLFQETLRLDHDWIGYEYVKDFSPWCMAEFLPDGRLKRLIDKPAVRPPTDRALVGLYHFVDSHLLRAMSADARSRAGENDLELLPIIEDYHKRRPLVGCHITTWLDIGTLTSIADADRRLFGTRQHNEIRVTEAGIVRKSGPTAKIAAEIAWYRSLPECAIHLAPRLIGADSENRWYETEYIDYPTMAELYLYGNVPSQNFAVMVGNIIDALSTALWSRSASYSDARAMRAMYIDETWHRLSLWDRQDLLELDQIVVNGVSMRGFTKKVRQAMRDALLKISRTGEVRFAHGDLAFSNILYSSRTGIFRIIDPRGSFGPLEGALGDPRYDAAKLRHSYHGGYDAIIHDLFSLNEIDVGTFDYRPFDINPETVSACDAVLAAAGFDIKDVALLEAATFLRMIPLHNDARHRQLAFFVRGLRCLTESSIS